MAAIKKTNRIKKIWWNSYLYKLTLRLISQIFKLMFKYITPQRNIREIYFTGIRRSGNHFTAELMIKNFNGSVLFFNNRRLNQSKFDVSNGYLFKFRFSKKVLIIYSFEDCFSKDFSKEINRLNEVSSFFSFILLRDPKNLIASQISHYHVGRLIKKHGNLRDYYVSLYKDNFASSTKKIVYNDLVCGVIDHDLIKFLGLDVGKVKIHSTPSKFGMGSSFDFKNVQANSVNNRFKKFENNDVYIYMSNKLQSFNSFFSYECSNK